MMKISYNILKDLRDTEHKLVVCNQFIENLDTFTRVIFAAGKRFSRDVKTTHEFMGNVTHDKKRSIRPDVPKWLIIQEPGGVYLYKPKLLEDCCFKMEQAWARGERAYEITGWDDMLILQNCHKEDRLNGKDYKDEYDREKHTMRYVTRTQLGAYWCVEYDGKSLLHIMEDHPKMPIGQIKEVIINEGGTISADGTIGRGSR